MTGTWPGVAGQLSPVVLTLVAAAKSNGKGKVVNALHNLLLFSSSSTGGPHLPRFWANVGNIHAPLSLFAATLLSPEKTNRDGPREEKHLKSMN